MGIISTPIILLPRVRTVAVDPQDHHPAADRAHRNGIRFRRRAERFRILHFYNRQFQ